MRRRRLAWLPLLLVLTVGCSSQSAAPAVKSPGAVQADPAPTPPVAAPSTTAPVSTPPDSSQLPLFTIPPTGDSLPVTPERLAVRPDGKAFALQMMLQGIGLIAWRQGDAHAVWLAWHSGNWVTWAPDGLYFTDITANLDGVGFIGHYRWGDAKPEVVIDAKRLQGYPTFLQWDAASNRLLYVDQGGPKFATADGKSITARPGAHATFSTAPNGKQSIAIVAGQVMLSTAGRALQAPLFDVPSYEQVVQVAWSPDSSQVAVEFYPGRPGTGTEIRVYSVGDQPRQLRRVNGIDPALFGGRLYYVSTDTPYAFSAPLLDGQQTSSNGRETLLVQEHVLHLTLDPAASQLYLDVSKDGGNTREIRVMTVP